jgi:hypothetical protein
MNAIVNAAMLGRDHWRLMSCVLGFAPCVAAQAAPGVNEARADRSFDAYCRQAGERIVRTVDNVDGIFLMKLRQGINQGDQFALNDPYGNDLDGDGYIRSFLREKFQVIDKNRRHWPGRAEPPPRAEVGYAFVEAINPQDGIRYRYTGRIEQPGLTDPHHIKNDWVLNVDAMPATGRRPRYGVTFDDISTQEDRVHWIAGSSLKVIDLEKNEVIAERIGYMMDPGRGSKEGFRSPWLYAANLSCPQFPGRPASIGQLGQTDRFVEKVLKPRRR